MLTNYLSYAVRGISFTNHYYLLLTRRLVKVILNFTHHVRKAVKIIKYNSTKTHKYNST